jgi:murein L,D-transpeptidase YafK
MFDKDDLRRSLQISHSIKKLAVILGFVAAIVTDVPPQAQEIPSSTRSREAISRVKPTLQEELSNAGLKWGRPIFIRIFKQTKELEVWLKFEDHFKLFKTYKICTYGRGGLGPKIREGDAKAPEGFYYVTAARMNPVSTFHLAFNIGYPNRYDRNHNRTGNRIMVHGSRVSMGCYAMTDEGIEEIYALAEAALRNGQRFFRVHVFPFRMTKENMKRHISQEWRGFWKNLKEGYDFFEEKGHIPPNVEVSNRRYIFERS